LAVQTHAPFPLVLVAHRVAETVEFLRSLLDHEGCTVLCARNGRVAQHLARRHKPNLLLLDEALPLVGGLELCRALRREGDTPAIVILSDQPETPQKALAFSSGADDYLVLPMDPADVLRRVWDIPQRVRITSPSANPLVRCSEIELDLEQRQVYAGGRECSLTALEFELLSVFVRHPNRVFSREALLERLRGFIRGDPLSRAADVHVCNLRHKLGEALGTASPIETVRGVGYRLRIGSQPSTTVPRSRERTDMDHLALAALHRAPVPLLVLSSDRLVLLYNESAQHLCGWAVEEVIGQVKCYSLLSCHDADGTLLCDEHCALRAARRAGLSDYQTRYMIMLKDGRQLPVIAHYSRLGDAGPERDGVVLMLHATA
jgi:DNA-binding response OmpR family regulator